MESLKFYLDNARNAIKVFGRPYMLKDEDMVSDVAHAMMVADSKFDETKGTLAGWRWYCAELTIRKLCSSKKKKDFTIFSINSDKQDGTDYSDTLTRDRMPVSTKNYIDRDVVSIVKEASYLTDRERFCILNKYVEYKTLQEIGDELGTSRENARQAIENGLAKIRTHM